MNCKGTPRIQYSRTYNVIPSHATEEEAEAIFIEAWERGKETVGGSYDDAGMGDLDVRRVNLYGIDSDEYPVYLDWYDEHYPDVSVYFLDMPTPPSEDISLSMPLTGQYVTTSTFNDPRDYDGDGEYDDLHEGIDFAPLSSNSPSYLLASEEGIVDEVKTTSGYGLRVVLNHGNYRTWYAHAEEVFVEEGDVVEKRQVLGIVGNTGNSTGRHVHFNLQIPGGGLSGYVVPDVVDPEPHIDPTMIVLGESKLGLHASADPGVLSAAELDMFNTANVEVIKVLSAHAESSVSALASTHDVPFIVRAFLSFGGRVISPSQFYQDTINDVSRTISAIGGREIWLEIHNEPNLSSEGYGTSWNSGEEFSDWFLQVASMYRNAFPRVKIMYPGLSPQFGGYIPFLEASRPAVEASDGICVHTYWAGNYTLYDALEVPYDYFARFPTKPLWVTEASNNRCGTSPTDKANEYVTFNNELAFIPTCRGVTYFVASASNPLFGWGEGGHCEVWLNSGIAEAVGARE